MFKFDPQQALTYQPLGVGHESSVYAYLEGQDDSRWVVKCIRINDPGRTNSLLQNILITTSASSSSVVPIKGHDIRRGHQGETTAYLKMPRMYQSLKDLIQHNRANQQIGIPLEQIVHCFHSIASSLDELALKEIAHRNLKPSNVLVDRDGHVYLSDIQMVEFLRQDTAKEMETRDGLDEDSIYKAPETFYDNWARNGEDLHKADAWSMGMVIAKACLIDSLIPFSPELPMEENRDIIEQNLTMINGKYGKYFAGIVRGLLALNPHERDTFSTIRRLLEETFPKFVAGGLKEESPRPVPKIEQKIIEIKDDSSRLEMEPKEESPILGVDLQDGRGASEDSNFLIWHRSEGFRRPKWMQFRKPEWFRIGKPKLRRPEWLNKDGLKQGLQKGKGLIQTYKRITVAVIVSILVFLVALLCIHRNEIARQDKFVDVMMGIEIKYSSYFKITFEPQGNLEFDAIWNSNYNNYYDRYSGQWIYQTLTDTILVNLMNDLTTNLASADIEDHVKWFKIQFLDYCQVTDMGISHLQTSLRRMTNLEGFSLDLINGPSISSIGLRQLYNTLSEELNYLKRVGISFGSQRKVSDADIRNLVSSILDNKKVTGLYFSLYNTKVSDDELLQLAQTISNEGKHLETLRLGLFNYYTDYTETFKQFSSIFLSGLSDLKELGLDFTNSGFTDESLTALTTDVTSMKKLRWLELVANTYYNGVTDSGLKYFAYELGRKKLNNLEYFAFTVPYSTSFETKQWLQNQLHYVPELYIRP